MKARYIRISTSTQSTLGQLARQHPDEKLFIDVISGSVPFNERPEAKKLLFEITMKTVDYVSVSSIDRLGVIVSMYKKPLNYSTITMLLYILIIWVYHQLLMANQTAYLS